jgi:hypothetical protein
MCFVVALTANVKTVPAETPIEKEIRNVRSANQAMLQLANDRLDREQQHLEKLRKLRNEGYASWLELSRQQLVVDSLRKQRDSLVDFTKFGTSLEKRLRQLPGNERQARPNYSQQDLQLIDYRLAMAKANSTGSLHAAEIELRRQRLRAEASEQLHADGYATVRALKRSHQLVERSTADLLDERERISNLKKIIQKMVISKTKENAKQRTKNSAKTKLDTDCNWPPVMLTNVQTLRRLIDLRRHYFDLQGQHDALACKLEMKKTCLNKIQKQISNKPARQSSSPTQDAGFSASLAAGQRKQCDSAKLDIEYLQARIQDFKEKLTITALEETKFVVECTQQYHTESIDSRGDIFTSAKPEYFNFTIDQRKHPLLLPTYRSPVNLVASNRRQSPKPFNLQSRNMPRSSRLTLNHQQTQYGTYSTQSIYPFGILRVDLRNRIPAGIAPWYLPGSPTNLQ